MNKIKKYIDMKDIIIFLIPIIIFITIFLAYYPGLLTPDSVNQWNQVQTKLFNNAHPFFSTYFMYFLSKICNSTNIVIIFQILMFSIIWSCICKNVREKNTYTFQIIYTIIVCLIPIISLYSITLWKDILYSYYLMALSFFTYFLAMKKFETKKHELILLGILLFLCFNYRHNGIIVVLLYFIIFTIFYIINNKDRNSRRKILIVYITFIVLNSILYIPKHHYLARTEKIERNKTHEISINTIDNYVTWIFGNYLSENKVTKKDKKFLSNIMNPKIWSEKYNGFVINSITLQKINKKYINENNKKYRRLFFKYTLKYPFTFIEHYTNADSLLLSVNSIDYAYVYVFPFVYGNNYYFDCSISSKNAFIYKIYTRILNISFKKPLRYFYQPGLVFYTLILMSFIVTRLQKDKNKKIYFLLLPMVLNTISLIPINLAQDLRYVYINYLTLILFGLVTVPIIYKSIYNLSQKKG